MKSLIYSIQDERNLNDLINKLESIDSEGVLSFHERLSLQTREDVSDTTAEEGGFLLL